VIAFSPWLDMENVGETLVTNDATDALITVPLLESMITGVLAEGKIDPKTPLANPLHRRRRALVLDASPRRVG
jgi:epsilon-lactone hydrolase